ncbi:MAG: hypothetical protein H0V89_05055 [Deltaproteobacteria bacterium]|nr:hypothetical protein [Deltaproteobacteria bacterium]
MIALLLLACREPVFEPAPAIEETGYLDAARISWTRGGDADPLWIVGEPGAAGPGEVVAFDRADELDRIAVSADGTFVLEVVASVGTIVEVQQGDAEPVEVAVASLPAFPDAEPLVLHAPDGEGLVAIEIALLLPYPDLRLVASAPHSGEVTSLASADGHRFTGHLSASSGEMLNVHAVGVAGPTASVGDLVP